MRIDQLLNNLPTIAQSKKIATEILPDKQIYGMKT